MEVGDANVREIWKAKQFKIIFSNEKAYTELE
jgi:hypothetical protein